MLSNRMKIGCGAVAAVLLLGFWVFFAPTKLGGSTTYSVTSGISMQPLLVKNDLALVRTQSTYHVGDVVLYNSQVLHKPVLHRIIKIQNGDYFFKGDNNTFVDPGYATRSELVGKLWFHIPDVGVVINWFSKPAHGAFLAALAAMAVVLSSSKTATKRRKRRHGSQPTRNGDLPPPRKAVDMEETPPGRPDRRSDTPAVAMPETPSGRPDRRSDTPASANQSPFVDRRSALTMTPDQVAARRAPSYLQGPTNSLVSLAALVLLGGLLAGIGFTRPTSRMEPLANAYQQTGSFSYSGAPTSATPVYPSGLLDTGDPIYPDLVKTLKVHFGYRFASSLPHRIKGTIELRELVLSQSDSWHQPYVLQKTTSFSGNHTDITNSFSLSSLYSLIHGVSTQSGTAAASYSVDLQPFVHITGTVGNQTINETFAPALPFTVAPSEITLAVASAPALPGATYVAPSQSSEVDSTVDPVQAGTVPHLAPNTISIAKYDIGDSVLRFLGLLFLSIALLVAVFHEWLRRQQTVRSNEDLIARRLHSVVVPVTSLAESGGPTLIEVEDFSHLASLAQFLERPILYERNSDTRTYAVDDAALRYIYRPHAVSRTSSPSPSPSRSPASANDRRQPPRPHAQKRPARRHRLAQSRIAYGMSGLVVISLAATCVATFTASNIVPKSTVGTTTEARQYSALAPAGCSSLSLTSMIEESGDYTNYTSHTLIIGSSGIDSFLDLGTDNCIVGGAGRDSVYASPTDVCIVGPTTGATYEGCTKYT